MSGFPVVIAENGLGIPVRPVEANAPVMTVAANGPGTPIVISDLGAPFIVEGLTPPWVTPGPDGALPVFDAYFAAMKYYVAPYGLQLGPDGLWPAFDASFHRSAYFLRGNMPFYTDLDQFLAAADGAFSRGSDATYFDASGILRTAGPNVLRLGHDPVTGKALGARLEGGSTRETNYPILFDGWSLWTGSNDGGNSLVRNAGLAPDGTMTANQLTAGADTSKGLRLYPIVTFTAATRRVRAVCLKEGTYRYARLGRTHASNASVSARIDLRTGEVTKNASSASQFNAGATPLRDGWWLCWLDWFDEPNPSNNANICITATDYIGNADSGWENSSNKPAPGEYIWVWGGSLQTGIPSSLILGSPAGSTTRLADSLTFARAGTPEGTVVIEARPPLGTGGNQVLWQWDDGTDANRYRLVRVNDGNLRAIMTVAGVDVVNLVLGPVANDADLKVVPSWRSGQFAASLNGAAAVVDTSYTGPLPVVSTVRCGSGATSGDEWFGTVARLGAFNRAYSPAQIKEMSA